MPSKAERLQAAIGKARKVADTAQSSYLRAEDRHAELAARERARAEREAQLKERR
jgi:hypothetical protein